MNTCTLESSVAALLSIYLDGKNISLEDMQESINSLELIDDNTLFIEELFLISMYQYIAGADLEEKLLYQVEKAEEQMQFNSQELLEANLFCKWTLIKALLGKKVNFNEELYSLVEVKQLSKLQFFANIAVLSFFIGIIAKNTKFLEQGCRSVELIIPFMKENGEVDVLFLHEKGDYQKDKCRVLMFLLMSMYSQLTDQDVSSFLPKLDPFVGGLFQSTDVEKRLLCRLLKKLEPGVAEYKKMSRVYLESEERIYKEADGFSFTSSKGKKVGIGSISHLGEIVVPSFAPHVLPLGKSDLYGLNPPLRSDVEINGTSVKMWNRVKSLEPYGEHFVYSSIDCLQNSIKLESFLWTKKVDEELSLVFFVRGNAICIDGNEYKSGGLKRIYEKTDKVVVVQGELSFTFQTGNIGTVEIIPLAGQDFFWTSDFIISFPYHQGSLLSIEIAADEKR